MAEGIKDKVAIIGMGCTKFGELWDKSAEDLIVEAFKEAIEDAGIERKDIQAAWLGSHLDDISLGRGVLMFSTTLKLPFIPVTRTENFCATGTEALRGACYAVASGAYDVVLALGVEKLKDIGYAGLRESGNLNMEGTLGRFTSPNRTAPGAYAMMATAYFAKYGLAPEEGKRTLAKISSKSHHNGTLNPKAHLRREVSVEEIMNAPIIAWPLGLYDCCGVSDGAAAAILTRADLAKRFRPDPVYIKAAQIAATSGEELLYTEYDYAHVETTYRAGLAAYREAGINNPRQELSLMETHDCFSINELTQYEDLGISPRGKAKEDVDAGFFNLDGPLPNQADGGLKCFGHPIGASGLRMAYEIYKQVQGKAGPRQIKNPKLGLTHNMGGTPPSSVVAVCILGV
jgi:acetyl-CoA C-acetyltransferase